MHPIERLRFVARSGEIDPTELAVEAAYALADLANDRRVLVQSCRRLLEFHPTCAPLLWVCAKALTANDLRGTLFEGISALEGDEATEELFALPASGSVVVAEASRSILRALCDRPDLAMRLVGSPHHVRRGMRYLTEGLLPAQGFALNEVDSALLGDPLIVIEPLAVGNGEYLLSAEGAAIYDAACERSLPVNLLLEVGRHLPDELFAALCARCLDHRATSARRDVTTRGARPFGSPTLAELAGLMESADPLGPHSIHEDGVDEDHNDLQVRCARAEDLFLTPRGIRTPRVIFHVNPAISHIGCVAPSELIPSPSGSLPRGNADG